MTNKNRLRVDCRPRCVRLYHTKAPFCLGKDIFALELTVRYLESLERGVESRDATTSHTLPRLFKEDLNRIGAFN